MNEDDTKINFVGDDELNKACFEIFSKIQEEIAKGTINESVAAVCDDPEKMIEEAKIHALGMMKTMGGARPTFVLLSKAGDGLVIPIILADMPENIEGKLRVTAPLTTIINLAPIDAYFFFAEMWMANYKEAELDTPGFKPPSQRTDRKEGVLTFAYRKGSTVCRLFEIERDENGTGVALHLSAEMNGDGNQFTAQNPMLMNFYDSGDQVAAFMRQHMVDDQGMSGSIN